MSEEHAVGLSHCRVCSWPRWLLTLAVPRAAAAQVLYGSIVGDVKDSTGALVPAPPSSSPTRTPA